MTPLYSGQGDDGFTGLLGEGRVAKHDLRPHAYGSVDEASAALGLARSMAAMRETREILIRVQRDLYALMIELAATAEAASRFQNLRADSVAWLEAQIDALETQIRMPDGFVLGGDSLSGAALDLARTVVRRAERWVAQMHHQGELSNPEILRYLNRLSSLCFVLMIWELHASGHGTPTTAKEP